MFSSSNRFKWNIGLVLLVVLTFSPAQGLIGKGINKVSFTATEVLSVPFGRGDGKIGYLNGPEHTPYPEAAQAFAVTGGRIMIVDTMNQRMMIFDMKTRVRLSTLWPNTETMDSYYSAVAEVTNDLFLAPELVNRALHLFNVAGKVKYIGSKTCPVDDITSIFIGKNGLIFLADKGLSEKKVKILDKSLEFKSALDLPDLISQSVALDSDDNLCSMVKRAALEDPRIDIFSNNGTAGEVKYEKIRTLKLTGTTLPPGRLCIAGVDRNGNYYVYWSALKSYFDEKNKEKFTEIINQVSELQPVAMFNVFDKNGEYVAEFFAPLSTSPASTLVTPEGELYVMEYDAAKAPAGNLRIMKYQRK